MTLSIPDSTLNLVSDIESMVPRDYSMADWKYEKLKEQIEEFQSGLSDDIDVCGIGCFWYKYDNASYRYCLSKS